MITRDVAGPFLNGLWGLLKTLEALPTGMEPLGADAITVEKIAMTRRTPEGTHPMLTRQVDGIGIGNGTSWVGRLTRHLVGSVHVQKISADERIALTVSSQRRHVVHVFCFFFLFSYTSSKGIGPCTVQQLSTWTRLSSIL